MEGMRDHYETLHVLPSADIDVIKAAFRALARRYHPDTYAGDKSAATKRMQEINDAYEVLSDAGKRKAYDLERKKGVGGGGIPENAEEDDMKFKEDWELACRFCPAAKRDFDYLCKLSPSLGFSFASYLLDTKKFDSCTTIAHKFQSDFLEEYFGSNESIREFCRNLLLCGELAAAKCANNAVKVVGRSLQLFDLRKSIFAEFPKVPKKILFLQALGSFGWQFFPQSKFLEALGVSVSGPSFFRQLIKFKYDGRDITIPADELKSWILDNFGNQNDYRDVWRGSMLAE
jgi:curved DNA-binding protein CbpA